MFRFVIIFAISTISLLFCTGLNISFLALADLLSFVLLGKKYSLKLSLIESSQFIMKMYDCLILKILWGHKGYDHYCSVRAESLSELLMLMFVTEVTNHSFCEIQVFSNLLSSSFNFFQVASPIFRTFIPIFRIFFFKSHVHIAFFFCFGYFAVFSLQLQMQVDAQLKQADDDVSDVAEQVYLFDVEFPNSAFTFLLK